MRRGLVCSTTMRCPNCDATILDAEALFCPRCGNPLGATEGDATTELKPEPETLAMRTREEQPQSPKTTGPSFIDEFTTSLRAYLRQGAWGPLTVAAAFGFLGLLAAAAILILGAKMQYPDMGAGSDPLHALSALVIVALGILRVPIHIGDLTVSALPLGALGGVGYLTVWATARALRRRGLVDLRTSLAEGVKLAVPFALICFLAALVFRIRAEPTPVAADAGGALLFGAIWGAAFGALGGVLAAGTLRGQVAAAMAEIRLRWEFIFSGMVAGGVMLAVGMILSALAALVWVIAGLIGGGPNEFGLGEAGAAIVYLAAFAPNVIVSILAVGLGAPVEIGAQVSAAGRLLGPLSEVSLFEWGGGDPPWFAYLLIVIPVLAALAGGFAAHRSVRRSGSSGVAAKLMLPTLVVAAATFSFVLFELAALSEARLGAGLIRNRGFGRVAPDAGMVLVLAACWAFVVGLAGWKLAESSAADGVKQQP